MAEASVDQDRRRISLHDPLVNAHYGSNLVRTSKYTWLSFLPLFLFQSFQKAANIYFLFVAVMQCVPSITNTDGLPTTLPTLVLILFIDAIFAVSEDRQRHVADIIANNRITHVLTPEGVVRKPWADIKVGNYLEIHNRDVIPADVLLLNVHNGHVCYVETKSLDGETNMKVKEPLPSLSKATIDNNHFKLRGEILAEAPNSYIHIFKGTLTWESGEQEPIPASCVLLRGCTLRNTDSITAFVLSTGKDTKIMRNNKQSTSKISYVEKCIDIYIRLLVLLLVISCSAAATGNLLWLNIHATTATYLHHPPITDMASTWLASFFYYTLLMYQFVPISLYVSMATVKFIQAKFIAWDVLMYHRESNTYSTVRSMNLNEELGQVSHLFTDKTGTLTCNMMKFRQCSIGGIVYGRNGNTSPHQSFDRQSIQERATLITKPHILFDATEFLEHATGIAGHEQAKRIKLSLLALASCHSVLPEAHERLTFGQSNAGSTGSKQNNPPEANPTYSASSPDEQALVCAAACLGYKFLERCQNVITMDIQGRRELYNLLATLEYTSNRRRMSVVVQSQTRPKEIYLFTKGADGVILPRMVAPLSPKEVTLKEQTALHLIAFAEEGLRTLTIAYKSLKWKEFSAWRREYQQVLSNIDEVDRYKNGEPNAIDNCMDEMEKDLMLLGATAIEDKLQDGVPDAILTLLDAGIKLWMLTGDKEETAINIGHASN